MPELPEVETTLRGLRPHLSGVRIRALALRERRLRYPVPIGTEEAVAGQRIRSVRRRAKYLLLELERGALMLHLGMSGSLRLVPAATPPTRHEHFDLVLEGDMALRFRDPRRFGACLWTEGPPERHPLLCHLGREPFETGFDGAYLYRLSRGRRAPIKAFIMDSRVLVGVGNIYASEALYLAGIHPARASGRIGADRYDRLAGTIRAVLADAIELGGTTLRDFVQEDGNPGYFRQSLSVYGRQGQACRGCGGVLQRRCIAQRSSVYCPRCQR